MLRSPGAAKPLLAWLLFASLAASPAVTRAEATPAATGVEIAAPFSADIPVTGTTIGAPEAPVEVVVWGDYTCPGCGSFAREIFPLVVADFVIPGDVRVTFRDYAFRGPEALRAAEAAACAADQDAFWPYHQTLFHDQGGGPDGFSDDRLLAMADALFLDHDTFAACLRGGEKQKAVAGSNAAAVAQGLDSVPTVFVAGVEVADWHEYAALAREIERALAAPRPAPRPAATPLPASDQATPAAIGGLELVFAARTPDGAPLDPGTAVAIRDTLRRRIDALGLSGGIWRRPGDHILVRIDATDDPARVAYVLTTPALLEIIDPQGAYLAPGSSVVTTLGAPEPDAVPADGPVYETIVSGADLRDVYGTTSGDGVTPAIGFELHAEAASRVYDYTSAHIGQPMSIVLDKKVLSSPTINGAIAASGLIQGLPPDEIPDLIAQLTSGALAIPLDLVESRSIPAAASAATPAP